MRLLSPILPSQFIINQLYKEILTYWRDNFYQEMVNYVYANEEKEKIIIFNETFDPLMRAIFTGRVWYADGYIYGNFNASISKDIRSIGGKFNGTRKAFEIDIANIPQSIFMLINQRKIDLNRQSSKANEFLDIYENKIKNNSNNINLNLIFKDVLDNLNKQFDKTVIEKIDIGIIPKLTDEENESILNNFIKNFELSIKNFENEEIMKLRQMIKKIIFTDERNKKPISQIIQERFNVAKNKAEFLASQEVRLLTAKYKESRYQQAGITKYMWSGAMDDRERTDHKKLQSKIFEFSNPPIVDEATGRRGNPGEDYGCRCVSIPLISDNFL